MVTWRCTHTKHHLMLRVFITRDGWLVVREAIRVPLPDWIERSGVPVTLDDVREGRAALADGRKIIIDDEVLPHDIDSWPGGPIEVGCRCGSIEVDIAVLAEHCRHARDSRQPVVNNVG